MSERTLCSTCKIYKRCSLPSEYKPAYDRCASYSHDEQKLQEIKKEMRKTFKRRYPHVKSRYND